MDAPGRHVPRIYRAGARARSSLDPNRQVQRSLALLSLARKVLHAMASEARHGGSDLQGWDAILSSAHRVTSPRLPKGKLSYFDGLEVGARRPRAAGAAGGDAVDRRVRIHTFPPTLFRLRLNVAIMPRPSLVQAPAGL